MEKTFSYLINYEFILMCIRESIYNHPPQHMIWVLFVWDEELFFLF